MTSITRRRLLQGIAASAVAGPAIVRAQSPIKLVYASYLSPQILNGAMDQWFLAEVTRRSSGRIVFETYYSASLLGPAELYPGLERGAADIVSGAPASYNPKDWPLPAVVLPYISDRADAVTHAFNELAAGNDELRSEFERRNAKHLWSLAFTEGTLWSNKRIASAADMKGVRVRATLGIADAFDALGATVVPMAFAEGAEALKRGAIDAFASSPFDASVAIGMHRIAKFGSDAGRMGIYSVSNTAFNKRKFDALDADARRIVAEVAAEVPQRYLDQLRGTMAQLAGKLAKESEGVSIALSSDAQVKAWRDATAAKVQDKWLRNAAASGHTKGARTLLDQYVAAVRKHEATSQYQPGFDLYAKLKA